MYPGKALVTTVLFNQEMETIYSRRPIEEVPELNRQNYIAEGRTALLDAIGETITAVREQQNSVPEDEKPEKTLLVITTDGRENASRHFTLESIRSMLDWLQESGNWQVDFYGTSLETMRDAERIGIKRDRYVHYDMNEDGVRSCYRSRSKKLKDFLD